MTLQEGLQELMTIDGALGAMVVDASSGMTLGMAGGGVNLELAAAGNSEVVKAKLRTMRSLDLQDTIEDMLITLGKQYHIIRPMANRPGLFLYLVIDRSRGNLALARFKSAEVEKSLTI